MPVTYELDPDSLLIHTRCTGDVTFEEVLYHFQELESDPSLPARLDVLLDLGEMQSHPETYQVRSAAGEIARLTSTVRWGACAVIASRDVVFGMARMFQILTEQHFAVSNVFREREEAEDWLTSVRASC